MARGPLLITVAGLIAVLSIARHLKRIPARCRKTPHPARFTRSSSFTAQGRSTLTGSCSCRRRRQSRGARGRSYNNRSAEIAGSAQPRAAAPESGAGSRKAMVATVLPALSSRLQPAVSLSELASRDRGLRLLPAHRRHGQRRPRRVV